MLQGNSCFSVAVNEEMGWFLFGGGTFVISGTGVQTRFPTGENWSEPRFQLKTV